MRQAVTRGLVAILAFALAACDPQVSDTPQAEPEAEFAASPCEPVVFDGSTFTHCTADPAKHRITTALAEPDGTVFRSLAGFAASRPADAAPIAFAVNAGMYDEVGQPIGYFVENSERLQTLSRTDGPGNFHLKPNGVFFGNQADAGNQGIWQVLNSDGFYHTVSDRPEFGTQSGPMLVIDGELHPQIAADGESLKIRNGVGIDRSGRAHFVISEAPVSFGKLARYYRDVLGTPQALFLDGTVSQLWDPARGRMDMGHALGPLIVVEMRETAP